MSIKNNLILVGAFVALGACGEGTTSESTNGDAGTSAAEPVAQSKPIDALDAILTGAHRAEEERARDRYRHPKETLEFFNVEPDMTVVEVWPGGGWYTQIIAPYMKSGGGKYYAAYWPREGASERALAALATFQSTYVDIPEIYGEIEISALGEGYEVAPAGQADIVLTFRNVHNWQSRDNAAQYFAEFYQALKPGGVLGVVEHRADSAELADDGSSGYVYTDDVKALAAAAGFEFDRSSDINANAADTKDHPFGVWTLPPVRRTSETRGVEDPEFDQSKYDAIGESDRMTLMFRKPAVSDGALLE